MPEPTPEPEPRAMNCLNPSPSLSRKLDFCTRRDELAQHNFSTRKESFRLTTAGNEKSFGILISMYLLRASGWNVDMNNESTAKTVINHRNRPKKLAEKFSRRERAALILQAAANEPTRQGKEGKTILSTLSEIIITFSLISFHLETIRVLDSFQKMSPCNGARMNIHHSYHGSFSFDTFEPRLNAKNAERKTSRVKAIFEKLFVFVFGATRWAMPRNCTCFDTYQRSLRN